MLRKCLSSNVYLSTSEEQNFHGSNALRPLRHTLKNSISLLMESNSSVTGLVYLYFSYTTTFSGHVWGPNCTSAPAKS